MHYLLPVGKRKKGKRAKEKRKKEREKEKREKGEGILRVHIGSVLWLGKRRTLTDHLEEPNDLYQVFSSKVLVNSWGTKGLSRTTYPSEYGASEIPARKNHVKRWRGFGSPIKIIKVFLPALRMPWQEHQELKERLHWQRRGVLYKRTVLAVLPLCWEGNQWHIVHQEG